MFSYKIMDGTRGPIVQILDGSNVIDECGPWESEASALEWAKSFTDFKESGGQEPQLSSVETYTIEDINNIESQESQTSEGES